MNKGTIKIVKKLVITGIILIFIIGYKKDNTSSKKNVQVQDSYYEKAQTYLENKYKKNYN